MKTAETATVTMVKTLLVVVALLGLTATASLVSLPGAVKGAQKITKEQMKTVNAAIDQACNGNGATWDVAELRKEAVVMAVGDGPIQLVVDIEKADPSVTIDYDAKETGSGLLSQTTVDECKAAVVKALGEVGVEPSQVVFGTSGRKRRERLRSPLDALRFAETKAEAGEVIKEYGSQAKPYIGGINAGAADEYGGTLGGFLIADVSSSKAKKWDAAAHPYLVALSNKHVFDMAIGADAYQPGPGTVHLYDTNNPKCDLATTCRKPMGKKLFGSGAKLDVAGVGIPANKHALCKVRLVGNVNGLHEAGASKKKLKKVSGVKGKGDDDVPADVKGLAVRKSGYRTHLTRGFVYNNADVDKEILIAARGLPRFEGESELEYKPLTKKLKFTEGGNDYESTKKYMTSKQEPDSDGFWPAYFMEELKGRYGDDREKTAEMIVKFFDGDVLSVFSLGGDSGSWIFASKNPPEVVALLNGGYNKVYETASYAVKPAKAPCKRCVWDPYEKTYVLSVNKFTTALHMKKVLKIANAEAKKAGYPAKLKVCTPTDLTAFKSAQSKKASGGLGP